jgi:hypothetical protein
VIDVAFFAAMTTSVPNNNIDLETGDSAAISVQHSLFIDPWARNGD